MSSSFLTSPAPSSAALWSAVDTDDPVSDDTLARTVTALMSAHGALRAVVTDDEVQIPDTAQITAAEIIAEDRTGPGALASTLDPANGLVWHVSRLSPTRTLICVYRGVVDTASWATVVDDARTLLTGGDVTPGGSWPAAAAADPAPAAPVDGGGPATYKTFDVSDADALLTLLPAQLDTGVEEILAAAVAIARAASGRPVRTLGLRSRGKDADRLTRTVGRLDRQFTADIPVPDATSGDLLAAAPAVLDVVRAADRILDAGAQAAEEAEPPQVTVEVSTAKISVTGPVRPVDGVAHVILGTQRPARVSVVDERGGADGVLLWRWLEQALISLSALARLIDAGAHEPATSPVPTRSRNLFTSDDVAGAEATADRVVDLRHLPEVNGFAVAARLATTHPGGYSLVLMPGVTDPKATGGRSGRVGSGVRARLISG